MEITLPCGLRVIHESSASKVIYCGYLVCAGTRSEAPADTGMAHFLEHMAFKGTTRRKAFHISNGLERVGGELNAFTTKQETVYYATVLRDDLARAVDLLTDITFRSVYAQHEIDREVEVICDEIDSYKDSPSELIFDEFESMMFGTHPLGRDILGEAKRLRAYTTDDALRFARLHYRPENCIFYVTGDVDFKKVVRLLEKHLADFGEQAPRFSPPVALNFDEIEKNSGGERLRTVEKDTHQAHVVMGAPTFGGTDPRRFAMLLLNNMLGGPGMNSRLNQAVRERAGLVYSIDAYVNTYPDTGFWNVYFGCDAHDIARCQRLVKREMRRFIDDLLTPAQLAAAKRQLIGQVGVAANNFEAQAHALAKTFAWYNVPRSTEKLCRRIEAVTAEELQKVAAEVYEPEKLRTLIYK